MPKIVEEAPTAGEVAPSETSLEELREAAEVLVRKRQEVESLEKTLKQRKAELRDYEMRELVDVFDRVGTDHIGLPEMGFDAVVKPYYHASISADWDEGRRQDAFDLLDEKNAGDLVKAVITITIDREDFDEQHRILSALKEL